MFLKLHSSVCNLSLSHGYKPRPQCNFFATKSECIECGLETSSKVHVPYYMKFLQHDIFANFAIPKKLQN